MKLAIVGSRNFCDRELVEDITAQLILDGILTHFISGGANGVDSWAECVTDDYNISKSIFHAHWSKYGKKAGYMRNCDIVKHADMVLAFWSNQSKGTKITIDLAIKSGKPVNIYVR